MIRGARPDLDSDHDLALDLDVSGGPTAPRGMSLPSPNVPSPPPVQVDELKRAWHAVSAGDFRSQSERRPHPSPFAGSGSRGGGEGSDWTPVVGERVVAVVGCVGSAGATTFALATGLASPGPTRVVECCSSTTSGLTAAATAELGVNAHGWRQGRREHVLLQRSNTPILTVDDVVPPTPADPDTLTILDVAWEATQLAGCRGWLHDAVANADVLVFVTPATTAGMRRLAGAVSLLTAPSRLAGTLGERLDGRLGGHGHAATRVALAVRGPSQRRWDRSLEHEAGADVATLLAHGALVEIPQCREIAVRGLESRSVPTMLTAAARDVLNRLERPAQTQEHNSEPRAGQDPGQLHPNLHPTPHSDLHATLHPEPRSVQAPAQPFDRSEPRALPYPRGR